MYESKDIIEYLKTINWYIKKDFQQDFAGSIWKDI
jgi:hypothetical protein